MEKSTKTPLLFALLSLFSLPGVQAQTAPLSLQQCIDQALSNNRNIQSATYDLQRTREQVRETASGLLPQVNLNGSYQYYLKMPVSLIPMSLFDQNAPKDAYAAGTFGTRQTTAATATLEQKLYDGQLLVGLRAAKVAGNVNELQVQATKEDIAYNVSAAYYNIQTLQKRTEILQNNLDNQDKLIRNTKLQLDNGITNKTTYNRLVVSRQNTSAQLDGLKNDLVKNMNLLKYLMGMNLQEEVAVEPVTDVAEAAIATLEKGNAENRTDLRMLKERRYLSVLDKKSIEASYLPTLSTSLNYGYTGYYGSFDPAKQINDKFYPSSAVQVNLKIPVFDGFRKRSQIAQRRIDIARYDNEIELKRQTIDKEIADAAADYNSNISTLRSAEENRSLAEKIYDDMQLQFKNGIVSLNDVLNAQNDMNDAQNNYTNALIRLRIAELDLKKSRSELLGNNIR